MLQVYVLQHLHSILVFVNTLRKTAVIAAVLLFILTFVCFIFAIVGVQLFGPMCVLKEHTPPSVGGVFAVRRAMRCLLVGEEAMLSDVINFHNIVNGMFAFVHIGLIDSWTTLHATLSSGPRPRAPGALANATGLLRKYLATQNASMDASIGKQLLVRARALLPVCQTDAELNALAKEGVLVSTECMLVETCLV